MDDGHNPPLRAVEKLEVEGEEERQSRIQSTLEKLNATSTKKPISFPTFEFGNRTPHDIKPPNELLSRVQAFLPEFEASNSLLAQRVQTDPKSVNIEHVEDGMDQYIEMNLGLGVFEDRSGRKDQEDSDADMSTSTSGSSESEDDSDVDTDSSSEIITSFKPIRPIRPLPKRGVNGSRPRIVVLGEHA